MAEKSYIVQTRLRVGTDKKGTPQFVEPGRPATLDEAEAAPLLACGAIKEPDVIPEESTKK